MLTDLETTLAEIADKANSLGYVHCPKFNNVLRRNFLRRARTAYSRNLADPGDCAGMNMLLKCLAVAEAEIGRGPGWIPAVQRLAVDIESNL